MLDWHWLLISTVVFLGGFGYIAWTLARGTYHSSPANLIIMAVGFAFQCMFLHLRGQAVGKCPIHGMETLVFLSWSIVLLYFVLGRTFRLSLLGVFSAPLVGLFHLGALPFITEIPPRAENVDYWGELHASVSLLAYGAFALACIAGVMFLVQDRLLKRGKLGGLSRNLPPINYLTKAILRLEIVGLILLTIGIASGFGMNNAPTGLHLVLSLAVWAAYAGLVLLKTTRGLTSEQTACIAIGIFLLPIATLFLIH